MTRAGYEHLVPEELVILMDVASETCSRYKLEMPPRSQPSLHPLTHHLLGVHRPRSYLVQPRVEGQTQSVLELKKGGLVVP